MAPIDPNILFKKLDKQIFTFVYKGVPLIGKLSELDCIRWAITLEIDDCTFVCLFVSLLVS
jgi:hypothetical protein